MSTLQEVSEEWLWSRKLTTDLLKVADEEALQFTGIPGAGPLWKQFRHIGRVHENYLQALESGAISFDSGGCSGAEARGKNDLFSYFEILHTRHSELLSACSESTKVDWFGARVSLNLHLVRLLSHETLHHGQLILYWRALGRAFLSLGLAGVSSKGALGSGDGSFQPFLPENCVYFKHVRPKRNYTRLHAHQLHSCKIECHRS